MWRIVCRVLALIAFALAGIGVVIHPRVNLLGIGLALWIVTEL